MAVKPGEINFIVEMRLVFGMIFVNLFILRCYGLIDTAWVWVFAPLWIPLIIGITLVIVGALLLRSARKRNPLHTALTDR